MYSFGGRLSAPAGRGSGARGNTARGGGATSVAGMRDEARVMTSAAGRKRMRPGSDSSGRRGRGGNEDSVPDQKRFHNRLNSSVNTAMRSGLAESMRFS